MTRTLCDVGRAATSSVGELPRVVGCRGVAALTPESLPVALPCVCGDVSIACSA